MKWRGSLRGEGALLWDAGERPVSYRIDLYAQGDQRSGNGDIQGDLAAFLDEAPAGLRLKLDDGREVEVALTDTEIDAARIELTSAAAL
jgi:hypothetical protein